MTLEPIDPNRTDATVSSAHSKDLAVASWRDDVLNVLRGFCMGAADTVPGVSGGTVALILGHYTRLVRAISSADRRWLGLLGRRRWTEAYHHVDGRFLLTLGSGIALGIIALAGLMHYLLEFQLPHTLATFLGLVLASVWVVRHEVSRWSLDRWTVAAGGVVVAGLITWISPRHAELQPAYLFFSAAVAICAMILPGISGAFILLLLGVYHPITGAIKDTARGNLTSESLIQMSIFASGCVVGLLAFSKLLRFLLDRQRDRTMAALLGLMLGSIGRLWPFQIATAETADLEFKERIYRHVWPSEFPDQAIGITIAGLIAFAAVLLVERMAAGRHAEDPPLR